MKRLGFTATVSMAILLSGCGGGDGGDGGSSVDSIATKFTINPSTVTVTPGTTTTRFAPTTGFTAFGATCSRTPGTYNVLLTTNAIVYNSDTVSAADLDNVARYTEAAVVTLRSKYGMTDNIGFDGLNKVKVCATVSSVGGSSGYNDLFVEINNYSNKNAILADLIKHEMTHMVQAQALNCQLEQYGFERWLTEGMALRSAEQDLPSKSNLATLQSLFSGGTPFNDTYNRSFPDFARYPAYRLAYDTFLGQYNKTDVDVFKFLRNYGATKGCPVSSPSVANWKTEFDAYFGTDLRGAGPLGSTFWTSAAAYAK
jgi:hypothetical protein